MLDLPFDLDDPPREPPPCVVEPLLWRVAVRLHEDHATVHPDELGLARCALCRQPYPCLGRQLARRGLLAAYRACLRDSDLRARVDLVLSRDLDWPDR